MVVSLYAFADSHMDHLYAPGGGHEAVKELEILFEDLKWSVEDYEKTFKGKQT